MPKPDSPASKRPARHLLASVMEQMAAQEEDLAVKAQGLKEAQALRNLADKGHLRLVK